MPPDPPQVAPHHLITALGEELARVNDNRMFLIALVAQQAEHIRLLESVEQAGPPPVSTTAAEGVGGADSGGC